MVRQLRIENNELRIRLEEAANLGNGMRNSLMGSYGTGNLPHNSGITFNQRKDSVVSNGGTGYIAL